MDPPETSNIVSCTFCPFTCNFDDIMTEEVLTTSAPTTKPKWIAVDDEGDKEEAEKHATIEEPCPKCYHPELYFYTMQIRSVDEGSTVFYECPKCKHKFNQNN